MLLTILHGISIFYFWTWFIWPFVFVFSFAYGIANIVKHDDASTKPLWLATISLLILLCGIAGPAISP